MDVLRQYKCPCCDGAVSFDAGAQKLKCPFCDTEFEPDALDAYSAELEKDRHDEMEWKSAGEGTWQDEDGVGSYVCASCGGELICEETTAATVCPFCGSPVVLTHRLSGELKPDCVIPFQVDKEAAVEALKKHYQGKKLLPRVFKDENHVRTVQGVYVPVWLFDASADSHACFNATRVRNWSDSSYDYVETKHYMVTREGRISFNCIPVDGSAKMDNALMESIEPYDFSKAVDFESAYLAGYLADKYDVGAEDGVARVNERVKKSAEAALAETVNGYSSVMVQSSSVRLERGITRYALYPVWLLTTKWKDENYYFAVNGQTGKLAGNLPTDQSLLRKWRLIIGLGAAVAAFAVQYLVWLI